MDESDFQNENSPRDDPTRMIDENVFWPNDDPNTERLWLPEDAENCGMTVVMTGALYENEFVIDAKFSSNVTKALPKRP
jgi:hypothetical protein